MGMVMLFGLVGGLVVLALISWLLSALTSISFAHWMLILPLALCAITACSMSMNWVKEKNQDRGLPLALMHEQMLDPRWLFPFERMSELSEEDKQIKRAADKVLLSPRWSYSNFATTTEIKISKGETAEFLTTDIWDNDEGYYGYQIQYPLEEDGSQPDNRFFITEHRVKPEGGVNTRLLSWAGQLTDKNKAIELLANESVGGMTLVGVDKNQTIMSVSYRYHSERQIFLFNHASGEMRPITEKQNVAYAKLEWANDSHYMMVVSVNPDEILLALYSDAKDYDDFFSSRGRSIPRISRLLLISDQYPRGRLLSRLRLSEQGMLMAIANRNGQLLLETLDQRDPEKPRLKHFTLSPDQVD